MKKKEFQEINEMLDEKFRALMHRLEGDWRNLSGGEGWPDEYEWEEDDD